MREQIMNGDVEIYQDNSKALPWIAVHKEEMMVFVAHDPYTNETIVTIKDKGKDVSVRKIGGVIHEPI